MEINSLDKISSPKFDFKKFSKKKFQISKTPGVLAVLFIIVAVVGGGAGAVLTNLYWQEHILDVLENQGVPLIKKDTIVEQHYIPQTTEEEKTINVVKKVSPSVVSIVVTKDVPIYEAYYIDPFGGLGWPQFQIPQYREKGTERKNVGRGAGFIISANGMVITNKHVILEEDAYYTMFLNDGSKYPAKVLAKDPFYDIAILQIDHSEAAEGEKRSFTPVTLGDSSNLQIGQTVIAIGYALGEFENTVSVGVISGLGRNIVATGGQGFSESLEGVIQTDAAINSGNSGGPLLNLAGEVIGINVARSTIGENIGFSLPINMAKRDIEQVKATGKIVYPFLGIYYTVVTEEIAKANILPVDYGAWVGRDSQGNATEEVIFPGSPAEEIGLQVDDIILEFDGKKITEVNSLAKIILQYSPGDKVSLKILRNGKEIFREVTLAERKD